MEIKYLNGEQKFRHKWAANKHEEKNEIKKYKKLRNKKKGNGDWAHD